MKPLAPFSRQKKAAGGPRQAWVFTDSDAWRRARNSRQPALVLPEGVSATCYQWPVAGLSVLVVGIHRPHTDLRELALELVSSGATLVAVLYGGKKAAFFRPAGSAA